CKTGAGAALLKDPDIAAQVVRAVVGAVCVPVTIKVRAGFGSGEFTAPNFVRRMVGEGASMVTLHARFAKQGHEGSADWELISRLREVIPDVPLVGNGDVRTPKDA
ncbi:MAG: tRNA dihydrouridine synthase DusB, partial [Armatimonadota bacterium]